MEKHVIIYGIGEEAQALCTMILAEGQATVDAFVADKFLCTADTLMGLPICDAENMEHIFPPEKYEVCISCGYKGMMYNREGKYLYCKEKGYTIFSFISTHAVIYAADIGEGCNIYPGVILMPGVKIGRGCFFESGCVISHNCSIGEFNFMATRVCLCGDVETGRKCFLGAGATVINGCKLGQEVFVSATARVNKDVKDRQAILPAAQMQTKYSSYEMMEFMGPVSKKPDQNH